MITLPEDRSSGCAHPRDSDKSLPRLLDVDILQTRAILDIWGGIPLQIWQGKKRGNDFGNDTSRCLCTIAGNTFWGGTLMKLDDRSMPRIWSVPPSTLALEIVAFVPWDQDWVLQRENRTDVPRTMTDYITIIWSALSSLFSRPCSTDSSRIESYLESCAWRWIAIFIVGRESQITGMRQISGSRMWANSPNPTFRNWYQGAN